MDPNIAKTVYTQTPDFTPETSEGLAVSEMEKIESFVDTLMRSAARGFPAGLTYDGYKRCTPLEEYRVTTAKRYGQHNFELAQSDIYMVAFYFSLNGVQFKQPRYLYLPYVRRGGIIHLRGVKQHISPVLADTGLSVENDNIFIWLSKTKLIFERTAHTLFTNITAPETPNVCAGTDMVEHSVNVGDRSTTVSVVYSHVHHINAKTKANMLPVARRNTAVPTLIHYILCKYGVTETFKRFCNLDVKIGGVDINDKYYPSSDWVICRSTGYKPRGTRMRDYVASDVRIAIPREGLTQRAINIVAGIFYVVDYFPERLLAEYLDEVTQWRIQLGHVIFKSDDGEGRLQEHITNHLRSIEEYMDASSMDTLNAGDIYVDDIYELFMHIADTMHDRILTADPASMYGKRLSVLNYVTYDIGIAINSMCYRLNSSKKAQLTEEEVKTIMNTSFRMEVIMKLTTGKGFVEVVSNPGDCMMFKVTNKLVPQTDATGIRNKSNESSNNPADDLHASVMEVGSFGNLPKPQPTGKTKLNPTVRLGKNGSVIRAPQFVDLIDRVQSEIKRR